LGERKKSKKPKRGPRRFPAKKKCGGARCSEKKYVEIKRGGRVEFNTPAKKGGENKKAGRKGRVKEMFFAEIAHRRKSGVGKNPVEGGAQQPSKEKGMAKKQ